MREAGLGGMLFLSLGIIRSVGDEFRVRNWGMVGRIVWRAATGGRGGEESLYFIARGQ